MDGDITIEPKPVVLAVEDLQIRRFHSLGAAFELGVVGGWVRILIFH